MYINQAVKQTVDNKNTGERVATSPITQDKINIFADNEVINEVPEDTIEIEGNPDEEQCPATTPDLENNGEKISKYGIATFLLKFTQKNINFENNSDNISSKKLQEAEKKFSSNKIVKKNIDNMSQEELTGELGSAQEQLADKRELLASVQGDKESTIAVLKKNLENALENYKDGLKELDEELASKIEMVNQKIEKKQLEIKHKTTEISDKEKEISNRENDLQNIENSLSTLQSYIKDISSENSLLKKFGKFLNPLKHQLEVAIRAKKLIKMGLEKSKKDLKILKFQKKEFIKQNTDLNNQKNELDTQAIAQNQEIKKSLDEYNKAKDTYNREKQSAINTVQSDIQEAQMYVNQIQTALKDFNVREVNSEHGEITVSKEMAAELETYLGPQYNSELEEMCRRYNLNPEDVLKLFKKEFEISLDN